MIISVDPALGSWLSAVDWTNVVGFGVVVPGDDLGERSRVPVFDEKLPTFGPKPVICAVNEVFSRVVLDSGMIDDYGVCDR